MTGRNERSCLPLVGKQLLKYEPDRAGKDWFSLLYIRSGQYDITA